MYFQKYIYLSLICWCFSRSAKTFLFDNVNVTLGEKYLSDLQAMACPIDRQKFPIPVSWWLVMQYHNDASLPAEPVNMKLNTLTSICCKHLYRIKICSSFLSSVDRHIVNQTLLKSKMFGHDRSPNLFSWGIIHKEKAKKERR